MNDPGSQSLLDTKNAKFIQPYFCPFILLKVMVNFFFFCQRFQPHSIKQGTKMLHRDFGLEGKLKMSKHEIKVMPLREQNLS